VKDLQSTANRVPFLFSHKHRRDTDIGSRLEGGRRRRVKDLQTEFLSIFPQVFKVSTGIEQCAQVTILPCEY